MWEQYRYTDPIAAALTAEFGTTFGLYNTGGGCICLEAKLEGGIYVLIGSAVDGPLLYESERGIPFGGGFGAGVYDDGAAWTGESRSYAVDHRAETAADVIDLVKRALRMAANDPSELAGYPQWTRDSEGVVTESRWP